MEILDHLALGFSVAGQPYNLLFCFIGVALGTLIGVLPGIGPTATVAMLLPITFSLSPATSLIMLAGIYYGAQYGGSTTAILLNLPGESSAAVTTLDGYQMARKGRAGAALGIAAIGSFTAGTFATMLVAALALPLTEVALTFGPAEYFSLMTLGLATSITLAHGSPLKSIGMVLIGLALGLAGTDVYTGAPRFMFGYVELAGGFDFVALSIGLFGVAEILRNLENETDREFVINKVKGLLPNREDLRRSVGPIWRGTVLGSLLGVLPGGGATLASFASYTMEKKISRRRDEFGKGAIEGVAGPESANNAAAQTSFIPMLTLGIPSNPVMALMIGAMIIQGIIPGPNVATDQPALFWSVIASMWIGNLMLVVLNLPLIGLWVRLLTIPYYVLFPAIMAFAAIGVFSASGNVFGLYVLAGFGIGGYLLMKLGCEPAPLLLGFILGPMLEENLRRAMMFSRGDPLFLVQRPISATLLILAVAVLVITFLPGIARSRKAVFVEES